MRWFLSGGLLCVPARVFGPTQSQALVIAIDTGCQRTVLRTSVLDDLGIVTDGLRVPIVAAGGLTVARRVTAPGFACLGIRRSDFPILSLELPSQARFDGLLGLDFIAGRRLCLDLATREIELT